MYIRPKSKQYPRRLHYVLGVDNQYFDLGVCTTHQISFSYFYTYIFYTISSESVILVYISLLNFESLDEDSNRWLQLHVKAQNL